MSDDLHSRLQAHQFCAHLNATDVAALALLATTVEVSAGAFVFREGEPAGDLYLVEGGHIALELTSPGGVHTIESLDRHDVLGLSWLVPGGRWLFDAHVTAAAQLIVLDGPRLHALSEANPALGMKLMAKLTREVTQRLQATRTRLLDLYR